MSDEERKALSISRIEKADRLIESAELLIRDNDYPSACNRAYYAIFHAMRSVLALDGIEDRKHSHLISVFRLNYIKSGIFDRSLSDIIGSAFETRNSSDYEDFWQIDISDAQEQVDNARRFVSEIEKYLSMRGIIDI